MSAPLAATAPSGAPTYSVTAAGIAIAAAATDVFVLTGALNKKVTVNRIMISGTATAAAAAPVLVVRRTTANTGGTATNPVPVSTDSKLTSEASACVFAAYTANPTLGTATPPTGGTVAARQVGLGTATAPLLELVIDYSQGPGTPPVLRSNTDQLAINFNGATYAGGAVNCTIEFTEEATTLP